MKINLIVTLALSLLPFLAHAGGSVGNGGGSWVCRNADTSVRWVKLVDFFEGENEFGLNIPINNSVAVDDQLSAIVEKTKIAEMSFHYALNKSLLDVKSKLKNISQAKLAIVDDALFRLTPTAESCANGVVAYEQLANFTEFGMILVQDQLFSLLSSTEKAGLLVHEAVYKMERERKGATNSVQTRKIVAELFSSTDISQYAGDLKGYNASLAFCDFCRGDLPVGGSFSGGIASFYKDGKMGYMNSSGQVLIAPQFSIAGTFNEGRAAVMKADSTWAFIDTTGKEIYDTKSKVAPGNFSGGVAIVLTGLGSQDDYGLINLKGELIIPNNAHYISRSYEGLFTVEYKGQKGCKYYNSLLEVVLNLPDFEYCGEFSEGLAPIRKNGLMGYINTAGQIVIAPQFEWVFDFMSGMARYSLNGKFGFIDRSGKIAVPADDRKVMDFHSNFAASCPNSNNPYSCDLIDKKGNKIGNLKVYALSNNYQVKTDENTLYPAQFSGGLWGYLDANGVVVIEPQFKSAASFSEGLAATDRGYISLEMLEK